MPRSGVVATLPEAQEAAEAALAGGASALGAVLTAYFVAAGADSRVLFAPTALLVGGTGAGVFAYDGRCRQPGRDSKRPRGFLPEEEIPDAARVAIPGSIAAAAVACAFQPGTTLLSCARPGVVAAKSAGSKGRAALIETVATLGATVFQESSVKRSLISQFGAVEQGLIGSGDLAAPDGVQTPAISAEGRFTIPWEKAESHLSTGQGAVAVDPSGLFAALHFGELVEGPSLQPFETLMPLAGVPVQRGVTRVAPGSVLPAYHQAEILQGANGAFEEVRLVPRPGAEALSLYRDPTSKEITRRLV